EVEHAPNDAPSSPDDPDAFAFTRIVCNGNNARQGADLLVGQGSKLVQKGNQRDRHDCPEARNGRQNGKAPGQDVIGFYLLETRLRSEEHTSELQSRENLVCRLLLEKKN